MEGRVMYDGVPIHEYHQYQNYHMHNQDNEELDYKKIGLPVTVSLSELMSRESRIEPDIHRPLGDISSKANMTTMITIDPDRSHNVSKNYSQLTGFNRQFSVSYTSVQPEDISGSLQ
jgi:hypothetical protein